MPLKVIPTKSSIIDFHAFSYDDAMLYIHFIADSPETIYEFENVTPAIYATSSSFKNGKGEVSFGSWFSNIIKSYPKSFPFKRSTVSFEE